MNVINMADSLVRVGHILLLLQLHYASVPETGAKFYAQPADSYPSKQPGDL
jgi:hypothetical protein